VAAPDASRINLKDVQSIRSAPSAPRVSREVAANPNITAVVKSARRTGK
jgi:hypothetical protein